MSQPLWSSPLKNKVFFNPSISVSVYLSACHSLSLSACLSVSLSLSVFLCLSFLCLYVCLSVSVFLSLSLSVSPPPLSLSVCVCLSLPLCQSVGLPQFVVIDFPLNVSLILGVVMRCMSGWRVGVGLLVCL